MSLGTTTPILRIFDEAKAKEFYVAFLGFHVDWEAHGFEPGLPLYMQVPKDACDRHLSETTVTLPSAAMRIEVSDLDDLPRRAPVEGLQVRGDTGSKRCRGARGTCP